MLVSPSTRALVARLPAGETRLGGPRLRSAYALGRVSRTDRGRIADELRRAGLEVTVDPYGLVVRKGRGLDPRTVHVRSADLPRVVRGSIVVPAPTREAVPRRSLRRRLITVAAAAAACAAVAAPVATELATTDGGGAPRVTSARVAREGADAALERTRAARRLGVLALRAVRAGEAERARGLIGRSHALAPSPVVETQRAARALARLASGRPPGALAG